MPKSSKCSCATLVAVFFPPPIKSAADSGSASDETVLAGEWYLIGESAALNPPYPHSFPLPSGLSGYECPSIYQLPGPTPGFEAEYAAAARESLPTHVHKVGDWCEDPVTFPYGGCDFWWAGNLTEGARKELGTFEPARGWEDLFEHRRIENNTHYCEGSLPTASLMPFRLPH